jgi:hypothetical protein
MVEKVFGGYERIQAGFAWFACRIQILREIPPAKRPLMR